jgi:predicted secreted protein
MVTAKARGSFGTFVHFIGSTLSSNALPVGGVLNIVPPKFSKTVIDITNHGTTDRYTQVPITLQCIYITTSSMHSDIILNAYEGRTLSSLVITIAGTSSMNQIISEGYVTDYGITTPLDEKVTFEMSFKASGKPVFQDSSSSWVTT